jgi:alkylation response protein AidB-like acyl-CoA dehydrogenase
MYSLEAAATAIWPPTERLLDECLVSDIADRAAAADESGVLALSTINLLRDAGYFGLPVPSELDGGGATLVECAAIQRRLGKADPALAVALNMHLFSVGMAVEHSRRRDACGLLLSAIATQRRVLASAFAEPGLGGALLRSNVKAVRTAGGYTVTGIKSPCSLAAHCDLVCLQMQADPPEPNGLLLALVPSSLPGIRVESTWDSLGMRASGSDTLRFDGCFVPNQLIFHRCEPGYDDDEVVAAGLVWFCVTTTATYLGVVSAAVDAARDGLQSAVLPNGGARRADSPSVQGTLGESLAGTVALEAACAAVAERIDRKQCDPRSLVPVAIAMKHVAVEACIGAVEGAAELLGAKSYARTGKLARFWRDVQAARFHPPTRLASRQLLGKWALQLPFNFELDERPGGD